MLSIIIITTISFVLIANSYYTEYVFAQKSMQTYENEKYGFKIQYPFNWEHDNLFLFDDDREYLGFFKPIFSSFSEGPDVSMSIIFLPFDRTYTLDEYVEERLQEIKNHKEEGLFHFNKLLSFDKNYTLGGKPAYKIVYQQWSFSSIDRKESYPQYIQVGTITDTIAYKVQFNTRNPEQFQEYLPIAEKIFNSFEFTQ